MRVDVNEFKGIMPKMANDKLPKDMGQIVQDAKTTSKELEAYRQSVGDVALPNDSYKTLFEYLESGTSNWAIFNSIVHWARSPIANDAYERTYFTGGPAVKAQGTVTFVAAPADGDTITIGTDVFEFDIGDDGVGGGNISVGSSATTTATLAAAAFAAATPVVAVSLTDNGDDSVLVEWDVAGVVGNAIAFTYSSPGSDFYTNPYGDTDFLGGTQEGQDDADYRAFANDLVSSPFDPEADFYSPGAPSGKAPSIVSVDAGDYVAYFYTFVSRYGEEGPPSDIGEDTNATDDSRNSVNDITYPTSEHLIRTVGAAVPVVNLYRTVATGAASGLFVYTLSAQWFNETTQYEIGDYVFYKSGGTSWDLYEFTSQHPAGPWNGGHVSIGENILDANLPGGTCPSIFYDKAVDGMTNLRSHPNGFSVASKGNVLHFSEPFAPWAWPEDYQIPLDATIIGIGVFSSTIVVCTDAWLYTFTGPHPTTLYKTKLSFQPCLSQRGVVETDDGVMFPSKEGFQLVTAGGVNNVTVDLFDPEDWDDYELETMHGTYYNKSYYGFYKSADFEGAIRIDFINGAVTTGLKYHYAGYVALQDGEFRTINYSDISAPDTLYISRWDASATSYRNYSFRSPLYILDKPANFKVAKVVLDAQFYTEVIESIDDSDVLIDLNQAQWDLVSAVGGTDYGAGDLQGPFNSAMLNEQDINGDTLFTITSLGAQSYVEFRLYADNTLKFTKQVMSGKMFKLPRGFKSRQWHFELSGMIPVKRVTMATSTEEVV